MRGKLISLAILLLSIAPHAAPAQDKQDPAAKSKPAAAKTEVQPNELEMSSLEQRGIDLIREAAKDSVGLPDRRASARVQSAAANLLWKHDQAKARELFEQAFETAINHYRETKDDNRERISPNSSVGRSDMRLDVIRLASRMDAELGRKLTDQYVAEKKREAEERATQAQEPGAKNNDNRHYGRTGPGSSDLLGAAQSLLASDQKLALELAERALAQGIPSSIPSFLVQLAQRDRAAGDRFYLIALERAAREMPPAPGQLLLLSAYPFGENRVYVSDGNSTNSYGFQQIKDFIPNQAVIVRFLTVAGGILGRSLEVNPAQSPDLATTLNMALFASRLLDAKVAKYQPEMADEWKGLAGRLIAAAQENTRTGVERTLQEMTQDAQRDAVRQGQATADPDRLKNLLDRADKSADFTEKDNLYRQAAFEAAQQGDYSQALSLAGKISDFDFKKAVLSWLNFDAATKATGEKRYDDAKRFAMEVPATDQRAYLFYQMASDAIKERDKVRAIELLEEAMKQASAADATKDKVRALLGIAHLYASIDSVRSFEVLNEAIKTVNKVGDYNTDQARLLRTIQFRGSTSTSVSTVEGFDLGKTLATFARLDFERALGLAQSLDNKSVRYETVIAIAATLFEKKPATQTS
jgi:hypothetical protein